jgi:hypothetical protein
MELAIVSPEEDVPMKSRKETARIRVANLEKSVKSVPTELVFNITELGCQEWAEQEPRRIIIPRHEHISGWRYAHATLGGEVAKWSEFQNQFE